MGHPKAAAPVFFVVVQINADDHIGPRHLQALNDIQPNTAQAKDHSLCPSLDVGGVQHSANARGHPATDVANLVKRRIVAHLGKRDFGHNRVVGKGRTAHVMIDRRAIEHGKAAGAVGHQALSLGGANGGAQVGFARQARRAFAAFGRVQRDDMIAHFQRFHPRPHGNHHARPFMAQNGWKQPFGISA